MREERGWNLNHMEEQEAEWQGEEAGWALTTFLPLPWKREISNFSLTRGKWRIKTDPSSLPSPPQGQWLLRGGSGYLAVTWAQPESLRSSGLDLHPAWFPRPGKIILGQSVKPKPESGSREEVKTGSLYWPLVFYDPKFGLLDFPSSLMRHTKQQQHSQK